MTLYQHAAGKLIRIAARAAHEHRDIVWPDSWLVRSDSDRATVFAARTRRATAINKLCRVIQSHSDK